MKQYKINRWILSLTLLLPLVFGVVACGGQPPVRPTSVMLRYEPAAASFSNSAGWNITLTKAELSLEYVRFHEGHSAYAQRSLWPNLFPALWLLPRQEAQAHPGHYEAGAVKAELRLNKTLNLLGNTSSSLGVMQAFTGSYGTGELTFGTKGMVALEGKATRDDKVVEFALQVPLSEQKVEGLNASHTVGSSPASVMLRVHVERWFELVDVTTLPGKNGATPTSASSSSVTILRKAVVSSANFSFSWALTALK